ncbi:C4-dicarboxylate TRAP transporter large permease protein DctM [subsurface metagenome]
MAAIYRKLNWKLIKEGASKTITINAMCLWIIIGAYIFSAVYSALGAGELIRGLIASVGMSPWMVLGSMLVIMLLLGMVMDMGPALIILVPIVFPILEPMGFSRVYMGILCTVSGMVGYISPPFGFVLFYMRALVPPEMTTWEIYKSVFPFMVLELLALIIFILVPDIVLILPRMLMGTAAG